MKNLYLAIILLLPHIGCTSRDNKVSTIEFAAWDIRRFKNDYEHNFLCRYFALIDERNECQIVVERKYQIQHLEYLKINRSSSLLQKAIRDIEKASVGLNTKFDFRSEFALYNGQNLIMQIRSRNSIKVINFWQDVQESKVYERLFTLIDSLYKRNALIQINDTIDLFIQRQKFIKDIIKPDSLLSRLPPPASRTN